MKQRLAADGETVLEQVDFAWDGTTLAEQTTHTPGTTQLTITITWDHDGLRPLAQTERKSLAKVSQDEIDQRFFAFITDRVGTTTELIDEYGDIAWRIRTIVGGTTAWNRTATTSIPLRFPGQYFDPETRLHYNYFRHYAPETARYLTPDPLGPAPPRNPRHTWSTHVC